MSKPCLRSGSLVYGPSLRRLLVSAPAHALCPQPSNAIPLLPHSAPLLPSASTPGHSRPQPTPAGDYENHPHYKVHHPPLPSTPHPVPHIPSKPNLQFSITPPL
eukprot:753681-Hanusia_phi.AAC.8